MSNGKILYILENFYPAHRAGTETYVLQLAKGLLRQGWQVSVVIAAVGNKSSQYRYENIEVYALSVPEKISTAELNGLHQPSNLQEFEQTVQHINPDIIHFHSFSRSFTHFHLKAAHDFGAKIFFTAHVGGIFCVRGDFQLFNKHQCNGKISNYRCTACYTSQKHNTPKAHIGALAAQIPLLRHRKPALNLVANKLQSLQYLQQYTHHTIAIARWIEKTFRINHINNTTLITQAIDTSPFTGKKTQAPAPTPRRITIGFIGRMNPTKGFYLLLEALQQLTHKFELHCITVPDPTAPQYYRQMKTQFARLGYTLWQENLTHPQINTAMDNWDALVLPSHHEVAPLTILEAHAKHIPVIGSDYPAIAEMIEHNKNGWLFQNRNSHTLHQLLHQLATSPTLLQQAAQNITPVKNTEEMVQQHLNLYKKTIGI